MDAFVAPSENLAAIAGQDDSILPRFGSGRATCYVAATATAGSARMHLATRSGPTSTLGGIASTQRACATPQRGAKEQLCGALSSEGGVPGMVPSRSPRLAPWTVEASSPFA